MDPQLLEALADILADALLADLEAELVEEQAVTAATDESPRGSHSPTDQDQRLAVSDLAPAGAHSSNPSDPIVVPT